MNYSDCRSFFLEGRSSPEFECDDYSNSRSEVVLPHRYDAELSALRRMLPKHPGVVDAVSHAAATILSTKIKPRHKPTLLHVLHRRIAADLQISLALYHGELCVQSTVQLRLDFDRFPTTVGPPVVYPDHPLRQSRMSFESLLARDDASGEDAPQTDGQQGEDHPAMHHFALRIQKSVKRLSRNPHHYERDAHADLDKITRDLEQAQALNERINRWCSAVRALESAMQVRGSRSSVSTAGVDACAADVAALAEVLLADVKEDEFRLAPEHEVYTGRLLVVRTAQSGGKQPRRQLATRPLRAQRPNPLSEHRLGRSNRPASVQLTEDRS